MVGDASVPAVDSREKVTRPTGHMIYFSLSDSDDRQGSLIEPDFRSHDLPYHRQQREPADTVSKSSTLLTRMSLIYRPHGTDPASAGSANRPSWPDWMMRDSTWELIQQSHAMLGFVSL